MSAKQNAATRRFNRVVAGVILSAIVALLLWHQHHLHELRQEHSQLRLADIANGVEFAAETLTDDNSLPRLQRVVSNYAADPNITEMVIVDNAGTVLVHSNVLLAGRHFTEVTSQYVRDTIAQTKGKQNSQGNDLRLGTYHTYPDRILSVRVLSGPLLGPAGNSGLLVVEKNRLSPQAIRFSGPWHSVLIYLFTAALCIALLVKAAKRYFIEPLRQVADASHSSNAARLPQLVERLPQSDITLLAGVIQQQREQLHNLSQQQDEFCAVASHDLKEPVRGVASYAQFLLEDYSTQLDAKGVEMLNAMRTLCRHQEALIGDLADFSRLGQTPPNIKRVQVGEALAEALFSLHNFIREHNAVVHKSSRWPRIHADGRRLSSVFKQLITNAVQYNSAPQPEVWLDYVSSEPPMFRIRDNGIGIPAHLEEKAFALFRRLHPKGSYGGGTGLGLAMARKIIEQHGGRIWIEATSEQGTTLCFTLAPSGND